VFSGRTAKGVIVVITSVSSFGLMGSLAISPAWTL
jgi:hypothetical protein